VVFGVRPIREFNKISYESLSWFMIYHLLDSSHLTAPHDYVPYAKAIWHHYRLAITQLNMEFYSENITEQKLKFAISVS